MDGFEQRWWIWATGAGRRYPVNRLNFNQLAFGIRAVYVFSVRGGDENEKASLFRGFRGSAVGSGGERCRGLRTVRAAPAGS
jgi:hypothetical protein